MVHCASKNCSNWIMQFSFKVEATAVNGKGLKLALVTVAEKIAKQHLDAMKICIDAFGSLGT